MHTVSLTSHVQKSMPHSLTIVQLCCMIHDAYSCYRLLLNLGKISFLEMRYFREYV